MFGGATSATPMFSGAAGYLGPPLRFGGQTYEATRTKGPAPANPIIHPSGRGLIEGPGLSTGDYFLLGVGAVLVVTLLRSVGWKRMAGSVSKFRGRRQTRKASRRGKTAGSLLPSLAAPSARGAIRPSRPARRIQSVTVGGEEVQLSSLPKSVREQIKREAQA